MEKNGKETPDIVAARIPAFPAPSRTDLQFLHHVLRAIPMKGTRSAHKNLIGTLMYLVVVKRADIIFAISYLIQFNDRYGEEYLKCAKSCNTSREQRALNVFIFRKTR